MTEEQVLRYLDLVNRKLELMQIGKDWKPEYDQEMEEINRELAELIPLAERERKRLAMREDTQDGKKIR